MVDMTKQKSKNVDVEILGPEEKKEKNLDFSSDFPSEFSGDIEEESDEDFDYIDITPNKDSNLSEDYEEQIEEITKALVPAIMGGGDLVPYGEVGTKSKDPLSAYMKEIGRYPLLSEEQEKVLTNALVETGDVEIAKKLVMANLRLVVKIAMEYRTAWQNTMDLIQEGNIGLMKAVSKYNPDKGAKLSYYASWWIRSYVLKYILDNFRLIKIGTTNEQKKLFFNLMKEKSRLEAQGIKPDTKLISENLGVSEKAVITMDKRLDPQSGGEVSIDTPMGGEGGTPTTFANFLEDEGPGPEEIVEHAQSLDLLQEHLQDFVEGLKERDKDIFKKRLLSEVPPSLQAIADEYGISRERVRQIEERLIRTLKVYMGDHIR